VSEYRKWLETIKISWVNLTAYKFNYLLMVLGPSLTFFFVKYNLWTAIYKSNSLNSIQGYSLSDMLIYQVWTLVVGLLAQSYNSMNIAVDIRYGKISTYLIYPFDFWQFHTASFIAFFFNQIVIAAITVLCMVGLGILAMPSASVLSTALPLCFLVALLWFVVMYTLGLIAFWLEETWTLRVVFIMISQFFSGSFLPLEIFPQWLLDGIKYLPFQYMTYVPVKVFMGTYTGSLSLATSVLVFWVFVFATSASLIWKRGVKLYTAAGI